MAVLRNLQKKSKKIPKISVLNTATSVESHVYYFGCFCLDEAERQLIRNGKPLRLAPKLFDVLLVLIQNKGSLVRKERLLKEVWPDVLVEEANLSVNIASLRKALDGGRSEEQWIQTVPKQGYRFMAPVFEPASDDAIEESDFGTGDNTGNEIINTVAVLPFENEGCGAVGEYLSDGLMESIINSLSRSRDLRVMARHTVYSCHPSHNDPRSVGHKLGVRSVLVGRILCLGDRLIVRTELIDVMNGWQLWGEQYYTKTADVLIVQQELTTAIAERLRTRLSADSFVNPCSIRHL